MLEDGRRRIFVLIDKRCGTLLRGEGANVDECSHPLVGTGRCNDSAAIRMDNENNRAMSAGERRPHCGRVVGDCVAMVLRRLSGEFRRGADWWAGHRSPPHVGTCSGPAAEMNQQFTLGCEAAQARLTSKDVKRKSHPDYRRGWNSYSSSWR